MSAYILDNKDINVIVAALVWSNENHSWNGILPALEDEYLKGFAESEPKEIGFALHGMNVNAVMQRYPDEPAEELPGPIEYGYEYKESMLPSAIVIYKTLQSYLYQCTEGDVDTLPLYKALTQYKASIAEHIVENLPQYETAPWA